MLNVSEEAGGIGGLAEEQELQLSAPACRQYFRLGNEGNVCTRQSLRKASFSLLVEIKALKKRGKNQQDLIMNLELMMKHSVKTIVVIFYRL